MTVPGSVLYSSYIKGCKTLKPAKQVRPAEKEGEKKNRRHRQAINVKKLERIPSWALASSGSC